MRHFVQREILLVRNSFLSRIETEMRSPVLHALPRRISVKRKKGAPQNGAPL
jgi:hypothetical protein